MTLDPDVSGVKTEGDLAKRIAAAIKKKK